MAKKVIIVTGPIGSGKSTAIEQISNKGYPTLDLDKISNEKESFDNCKKFLDKIIFFNSLINLSFERFATPAMFCLIDFLTDELWG